LVSVEISGKIIEQLKIHSLVYLEALLVCCGYLNVTDETTDGYLYTNNYDALKEKYLFVR
jgi:hypothetical protein